MALFLGRIRSLVGLVSAILIMPTATTNPIILLPSRARCRPNHISSELNSSRADRKNWLCQPLWHAKMGTHTCAHTMPAICEACKWSHSWLNTGHTTRTAYAQTLLRMSAQLAERLWSVSDFFSDCRLVQYFTTQLQTLPITLNKRLLWYR